MSDFHRSRRRFISQLAFCSLAAPALPQLLAASPHPEKIRKDRNLVILFQGDSITDGNRGRNNDPNHIMGHGYAFTIASRWGADFPERQLAFINRGISGNKVPDLARRWQTDTLHHKPDVLSILVGVNDAASVLKNQDPVSVPQYEAGYRDLLQQVKSQLPHTLLVLGEPFILPVGPVQANWEAWQADIRPRQEVVARLAREFGAVEVKYQSVFDKALRKAPAPYWIWDGIHPTVAGHELMAREWIRQVTKRLPFLK